MKRILPILLFCAVLASCSNDNDEKEIPFSAELKLVKTGNITIEPFEEIKLRVDADISRINELLAPYDSVVWDTNGFFGDGIIHFSPIDDAFDLRITDYRIGKHKTYLRGYKDGKIISQDSVEYTIEKPKSNGFLSAKWGGNKGTYGEYISFMRYKLDDKQEIYGSQVSFGVTYYSKNEAEFEHATLEFMPIKSIGMFKNTRTLPNLDEYDFAFDFDVTSEVLKKEIEVTRSFFHEYITEIYGKSTCVYEGADARETTLWDEYGRRFKMSLNKILGKSNKVYPVEIWDTPTSHICMYSSLTGWYYVVAEPRK